MRTKKQVLAEFHRLQRKYADFVGIIEVTLYRSEGAYWTVKISASAFNAMNELVWNARAGWTHYTYHNDEVEAKNEEELRKFIKELEERA